MNVERDVQNILPSFVAALWIGGHAVIFLEPVENV